MGVDASLWLLGSYAGASVVLQVVACFAVARAYWGRVRSRKESTLGQGSGVLRAESPPRWPKLLALGPLPVPPIVGSMLGHPRDWVQQGYYDRLRVLRLAAGIMVEGIVVSAIIVGVLALLRHRARASNADGIGLFLCAKPLQIEHWLVGSLLASLPFLVGVHLFARQITNSLADGPIFGAKRLAVWMATNAASDTLRVASWLSILCIIALATIAMALVRKATGTARGWNRAIYPGLSLLILGGAAFIVTRGAPLAAENALPWPAPSSAAAYEFHGVAPPLVHLGRCPHPILSAPGIELRLPQAVSDSRAPLRMRVHGWAERQTLDQIAEDLATTTANAGLLAFQQPNLLNLFAEPEIPTSELGKVLALTQRAGFQEVALACGEQQSVDRPLLGRRTRVLASTIRLTLTKANQETSHAFHTSTYQTIGEMASRVLESPDPIKEHLLVVDETIRQ